jgi:hypothetical protein
MLTHVAAGDSNVLSPPNVRAEFGRTAEIPGDIQFDDLEGRDLLHAGRAGCRDGFAALNHGLEAMAN